MNIYYNVICLAQGLTLKGPRKVENTTSIELLQFPHTIDMYDLILSSFYFKLDSTLRDVSLPGFVCLFDE